MSMGYNNWMPSNNWAGNWSSNSNQFNNNFQQPINNVLRVTGPESAKAYPLPSKSTIVLFDAENPIFYFKSTDDGGFATPLRTFKFEEITPKEIQPVVEQIDASGFATKEDVATLSDNVAELKQMLEGLIN